MLYGNLACLHFMLFIFVLRVLLFLSLYNRPENKSGLPTMSKNWKTCWKFIEPLVLPYQIWWTIHAGAVFNSPGAPKSANLSVVDDFIVVCFDDVAKTPQNPKS